MKNLFLLLSLFFSFGIRAQDAPELTVAFKAPQNVRGFDQGQLSRLDGKLKSALQRSNVLVMTGGSDIVLLAEPSFGNEQKVDAGTKKLTTVDLTLNLTMQESQGKMVFGAAQLILKGSGNSRNQAVMQAMNNISPSDTGLKNFIETSKTKALQYYDSHCDAILARAEQLKEQAKWEEAVGLLATVPQSAACHARSSEASMTMYRAYLERNCQQTIVSAKAKLAANDYTAGLAILKQVDPGSSCFAEANQLFESVAKEVDEENLRSWDAWKEMTANAVRLEELRMLNLQNWVRGFWGN